MRARMRGRMIEPFEDLGVPDGQELEVAVNSAEESGPLAIVAVLTESAGAWTDGAYPELATRNGNPRAWPKITFQQQAEYQLHRV